VSSDLDGLLNILDAHGAELHALLTRLTLRAEAAEDLLQDLFLKLRDSAGLAKARNPKAYVFQSAIHLAFDWRRAHKRTEPLHTEPVFAGESTLDHLIGVEEFEQVLGAMEHLSELARQVVVLRYLQHQEYAEIADELDKTEHQVRALCHKALGQLQAILKPAAPLPEKRGNQT